MFEVGDRVQIIKTLGTDRKHILKLGTVVSIDRNWWINSKTFDVKVDDTNEIICVENEELAPENYKNGY